MEGSRVGPYRVGTLLGAGGMGRVYSATAEEPADGLPAGTRVALKVIHPHLLGEEDFLERFLREAEAGRRIRHANVVRTVGAGSASVDGRPRHFIAMEYVEGRTLRALLEEMGRVPEALLREVGRQVARGLGAIHDAGVLHRDLKPDNVLITADHEVKIMDLGVARLADASLLLTRTGAFVGSIPYAAPECFRASLGPRDHRADLHALGLVLHELATGSAPYDADDVPGAIRRVLEERPRRLGEVAPQVSPFLEEVVGVLLEKDPTKRFPDAGTLLRVLEEGEAGEWWASRSRSPGAEGRRFARRVCLPRETRVHGRDADLSQLREWFGRARSGGGGTVLVEGEAGIGKSRLVDEFAAELARGEEDVLFLVGGHPPGGAATASGALAGAFRDHLGADEAGRYLRHIPLLAPAFDALLRGDRTPEGAEPLNRESMQTCFVEVLRGLAEERPVLLLVEDLHFAPAEARSLFAALAHAVGGRRVLLVGTARPGLDPRWISDLERGAGLRRMTLGRLGPGDLVAMLTEHLGSRRLAEELADRISAKSDGNPFFAFEVLRALREGGLLARQRDGSWETTGVLEGIEVPDSVLDLVRARLADLGEEERGVLEVGACAGFEFDPLLAGEVLGMPRIPLLRLLGRVEARSRLVRAAGARFVFDHHLVQEVLLGGMSEPLREEYHAALAAALEARAEPPGTPPAGDLAVAVCTHFLAARRGPEGLRHLDAALARLESSLQAERAWELVRRALDVPGAVAGTDRADLLLRGARYLTPLGRTVPQREALEEARQLADAAGDPRRRVASRALLGWSLWCSGAFLEAEEVLRKGLDLARETGNVAGERWVVSNLLTVHLWQERLDEAEADLDRMEVLLRGEAPPAEVVAFHGNWGLLLQKRGRFEEALQRTGAALEAARATGSRSDMGSAMGNQGALLWNLGRGAEARERFERQADLARSAGDRRGETNAIGMLGSLLRELGLPEEAGRCIHRHRMLAEERADGYARALAAGNEALLALDLGEAERACGAFEDAADRFRGLGLGSCLASSLRFMAVAVAEAGRPAAAASFLAGSLEAAREAGDSWEEAMTRLEGTAPPEGGWESVEATVLAAEEARPLGDRLAARLGLHLRTGREPHLAEARRILDVLVANAPPECREPMRSRVRIHRMVERAWESRPSRG